MNWHATIRTTCAVVLTLAALFVGAVVTPHVTGMLDALRIPNVQPTLDAISGPRGTLWQANKAIVKIGDAVVTTQMQERAITPHTLAAVDSLATIAPHANAVMDSAARTADMASDLTVQATETLKTVNDGAGPLLAAYTASGNDLDALLKSHALANTLDNLDATTQNIGGITLDLRMVTDKASKDYLTPKPWYRKVGRFAGDAFDYGALFARHVP